jgi:hypothetical protein
MGFCWNFFINSFCTGGKRVQHTNKVLQSCMACRQSLQVLFAPEKTVYSKSGTLAAPD